MGKARKHNSQIWEQKSKASEEAYWLYCIAERGCENTGPCKVGVAAHVNSRFSSLQCGNWRELVIVWQIKLKRRRDALDVEQYCLITHRPDIYTTNDDKRLQSEWVDVSPSAVLETAMYLLNIEDEKFVRVA